MKKDKGKGMKFEDGPLLKHFSGKPSPVGEDEFNRPKGPGELERIERAIKDSPAKTRR